MQLYSYNIVLKHDRGTVAITQVSQNIYDAIAVVLKSENAPDNAIVSITQKPLIE